MSDVIAIAIDKVGEPDPKAPEAQAGAPTVPTTEPEESKPDEKKPDEKKSDGAAELRAKIPKPVEITSVPETPVDNRTPAGGTPRPELKLDEEPKEKAAEEAQVILGPGDASSEAASKDKISSGEPTEELSNGSSKDDDMKDAPVSEATSDSGSAEKRKLDDEPEPEPVAAATNGKPSKPSKPENNGSDARSKKARVDNVPAQPLPAANGKNGKAKREKKIAPPVGRTARKTRSQGPVEV